MADVPARRPAARPVAALLTSVLAVLLTGCGDSGSAALDRPAATSTVPLFNPCDALEVSRVSALLGAELRMDAGTPTSPTCSFTPTDDGGPVLDANYLLFPQGLDEVFATMGDLDPDDVSSVVVPGADDARVVVDFDDQQLFVTGFVQDGDLIQTVDVVHPQPYDRARVVRAVRQVLVLFSQAADSAEDPP